MQDFSKEDFNFFNINHCYPNNKSTGDLIDLESVSDKVIKNVQTSQQNQNGRKIDENSGEIYKWHLNNIGINLLKTSDDPLISSVQENSDQNENELVEQKKEDLQSSIHISSSFQTPSPLQTNCQVQKPKTHRTRRKEPVKLRFHHQALPQEYLTHYENQQKSLGIHEVNHNKVEQLKPPTDKKSNVLEMLTTPNDNNDPIKNENIISWLQNILEMQQNEDSLKTVKNLFKVKNTNATAMTAPATPNPPSTPSKTQNLKDLPYMGEMTLENTKPRRGRKPKKADICHLIYKNYGTIVPGTVPIVSSPTLAKKVNSNKITVKKNLQVVDKTRNNSSKKALKQNKSAGAKNQTVESEPLNLCIRDTSRLDPILISDSNEADDVLLSNLNQHVNTYSDCCDSDSIDLEFSSTIPSLISPLDLSGELASIPEVSSPQPTTSTPMSTSNSNYMCWPNSGIFMNPMALYYQKMIDEHMPSLTSSTSSSTSSLLSVLNNENSEEIDSPLLESPPVMFGSQKPDFVSDKLPQMIKSECVLDEISDTRKTQSPLETKFSDDPSTSSATHSFTSHTSGQSTTTSTKRKRSAIFIPPVQTENSSNPATEVSICKFKFTGGSKPSLQEKKILSVDAGGNFRYYSGTGDKSMRGYEFFPRESLRQSSLLSSSTANAFLNASGEKIPMDNPPTPVQVTNDSIVKDSNGIHREDITEDEMDENLLKKPQSPKFGENRLEKKKKTSNRSIQRANLEKAFKEKGFLIQTQQLQSAEGATYCKFRQLRKFTRYLFRSWKDYLPTNEAIDVQQKRLQQQHNQKQHLKQEKILQEKHQKLEHEQELNSQQNNLENLL